MLFCKQGHPKQSEGLKMQKYKPLSRGVVLGTGITAGAGVPTLLNVANMVSGNEASMGAAFLGAATMLLGVSVSSYAVLSQLRKCLRSNDYDIAAPRPGG
jgi:hypothetical protein